MHKIALIRGDGIGPEISDAAVGVIEASGAAVAWEEAPMGLDGIRLHGTPIPLESLAIVRRLGVALKGPMLAERCSGGVTVGEDGALRRYPSVNSGVRRELGAYVNVRPLHGWRGISGRYCSLDIVIIRETTEDIYSGIERQVDDDTAEAVKRITRSATRRAARFACEYASRHGRRKVTAVHKANVLHLTDGLFLQTVGSVVSDYPQLIFEDCMVDATCYLLLKCPEQFDVLVLPNQYGDILSDLAAGLVGSLGLAPGANIAEETAVFEAAHGAAPDIAGQNLANPIGLILSGALLLDHLGELEAAERIRLGVRRVLLQGRQLTPDLGGSTTTRELTKAICDAMER
jgi:isocitrate dehydrogenase (NAD+)